MSADLIMKDLRETRILPARYVQPFHGGLSEARFLRFDTGSSLARFATPSHLVRSGLKDIESRRRKHDMADDWKRFFSTDRLDAAGKVSHELSNTADAVLPGLGPRDFSGAFRRMHDKTQVC